MDETERIRVRCPECDHPVATVPAGFRFDTPLVCPGCGAELEPPSGLERLAHEVSDVVGRLLGGGRRQGKGD